MNIRLLIMVLCLLVIYPAVAQVEETRFTLEYDGLERAYELHVPESVAEGEGDVPLLIALHQFSSTARAMQLLTDLNALADEMGMIVVYPENTGFGWNNGTGEIDRGYFGMDVEYPDDLGFITTITDELLADYPIDPEQVYLVGGENGGLMATYLACQIPERFAGVMVVGATMWEYQAGVCPETATEPVDILFMLGLNDWFYPTVGRNWSRTREEPQRYTLSFQATLEYWAERNGCALDSAGTPVDTYHAVFTDCETAVRTMLYAVEGGGGAWFYEGDYTLNQFGITTNAVLQAFIRGDDLVDYPAQNTDELDENVVPLAGEPPAEALPRSFRLYVPPTYDPDEAIPLVLALHGRPDTGVGFSVITQLHLTAARENFLVLYPDGINLGWQYTNGIPGFVESDVDDIQFVEDLIVDLSQDINIDMNRVYVTGFSNGGFFTERLACSSYDFFAAYAVVGATAILNMDTVCDEANDIPMMFMHGTNDVSIPWEGHPRAHMGVIESLFFWVDYNDCNFTPREPELIPPAEEEPETFVMKVVYEDCAFGGELWFYGIQNGGHNWAGVPGVIGDEIAGLVNTDIHASDVVWEYMSQFRLDE